MIFLTLSAALLRLAQDQPIAEAGDGPYALIADLVGIARGGPDDLARRHKQAFRDIVSSKSLGEILETVYS